MLSIYVPLTNVIEFMIIHHHHHIFLYFEKKIVVCRCSSDP